MPAFLGYVLETCTVIREHPETIRRMWQHPVVNIELWLDTAASVAQLVSEYRQELAGSSALFGEQLFDGNYALLLNHCLLRYAESGKAEDPKFAVAVELLIRP